jgi:hypothetical protein
MGTNNAASLENQATAMESSATEIARLNRVIVSIDKTREFRLTPVYEKMVGGSDVCATCEAHCVVMEEDEEAYSQLEKRLQRALAFIEDIRDYHRQLTSDPEARRDPALAAVAASFDMMLESYDADEQPYHTQPSATS